MVLTLIVLGTLIVCMTGAEIILSLTTKPYHNAQQAARLTIPQRLVRLRERAPNTDIWVTTGNKDVHRKDGRTEKRYRLDIDERGFIKPSRVHEDPELEIVFLGGSSTESVWVDEDKRFPSLTGRLLEASLGRRVNTYNSGVSGNNTMHANILLLAKIVPLRPDVVVLMNNLNDLGTLFLLETYWREHFNRGIIFPRQALLADQEGGRLMKAVTAVRDLFFPNLWLTVREVLDPVWPRKGGEAIDEVAEFRGRKVTYDGDRIRQQFRDSLETFVAIARAWQIVPVLMTQPNRFDHPEDPENASFGKRREKDFGIPFAEYIRLYKSMNETIREVAREKDLLLIDLELEIPSGAKYQYDAIHFTEAGSEITSRKIAVKIEPLLKKILARRDKVGEGRAN